MLLRDPTQAENPALQDSSSIYIKIACNVPITFYGISSSIFWMFSAMASDNSCAFSRLVPFTP